MFTVGSTLFTGCGNCGNCGVGPMSAFVGSRVLVAAGDDQQGTHAHGHDTRSDGGVHAARRSTQTTSTSVGLT